MKEYTLENLEKDGACYGGMRFVHQLLDCGSFTPQRLFQKCPYWLVWAVSRGYTGRELADLWLGPNGKLVVDALIIGVQLTRDGREYEVITPWSDEKDEAQHAMDVALGEANLDHEQCAIMDALTTGTRRPPLALLARHLIGDVFTQEHYDLLTGPWRRNIGPIHPDDEVLA